MLSAHMRGILLYYPTPRRTKCDTPRPPEPPTRHVARGLVVRWAFGCGDVRAYPPLSLRRSTINVGNVGVRLWQSSAICLRAFARSAFLFTGSPRFARDDNGDEVRVLECSTPPPVAQSATPPAKGGGHSDISLYAHPLPLVIPAPGVPANTNVFVGWTRRE